MDQIIRLQISPPDTVSNSSMPVKKGALKAADMEEEAARLEEDYNKNFLLYEGFNLSEAFKSQAAKVDKDWRVHEQALVDDYRTRRRAITGFDEPKGASMLLAIDDQEIRWQHPEKQKTLIHTAPVFTPIQNQAIAGSAMRAVRSRSGREDASINIKEVLETAHMIYFLACHYTNQLSYNLFIVYTNVNISLVIVGAIRRAICGCLGVSCCSKTRSHALDV